jgi:hypothetical protein
MRGSATTKDSKYTKTGSVREVILKLHRVRICADKNVRDTSWNLRLSLLSHISAFGSAL